MARFATDKDSPHGYIPDYLEIVAQLPPAPVICEIGVLRGDSFTMWRELCPDATLIGVDNDPNAAFGTAGSIGIVASQDYEGLDGLVREHAPDGCDLIVDDASHIGHLTAATFSLLWPLVKPGGCYVVEDWADPWVSPELMRWPDVDPKYVGDELIDFVPDLITALQFGAKSVKYTYEGLVILWRK